MIDKFELRFSKPLTGFRFKPGECIVSSNWADEFRWRKRSQSYFDGMKMVVLEVRIGKGMGVESYRLLRNLRSPTGNAGQNIEQWFKKTYIESNFEICDYPAA